MISQTIAPLSSSDAAVVELDRSHPDGPAASASAATTQASPPQARSEYADRSTPTGQRHRPTRRSSVAVSSVGGLEVRTTRRRGHVSLSLAGDMDVPASEAFSQYLSDLAREGVRSLVIDMAGVSSIGAAGILALQGGRMAIEARRGELILKSLRSATLAAMSESGLSGCFSIT